MEKGAAGGGEGSTNSGSDTGRSTPPTLKIRSDALPSEDDPFIYPPKRYGDMSTFTSPSGRSLNGTVYDSPVSDSDMNSNGRVVQVSSLHQADNELGVIVVSPDEVRLVNSKAIAAEADSRLNRSVQQRHERGLHLQGLSGLEPEQPECASSMLTDLSHPAGVHGTDSQTPTDKNKAVSFITCHVVNYIIKVCVL